MNPLLTLPAYDAIIEPETFIWMPILLLAVIAGAAGLGFWLGRRFAKPQLVAEMEERKQAKESMRESEAWLNAYFASSPSGMPMVDPQLRYMKVNHPLADITGAPLPSPISTTIHKTLPHLPAILDP